jgi:hypothetical protein
MRLPKYETYTLPEWALEPLTNEYFGGITDEQQKKLSAFMKRNKLGHLVKVGDGPFYFPFNSLSEQGGICYECRFIVLMDAEGVV